LGIDSRVFEFLLHEHCYKPISGKVLTIGRQAVIMTPDVILSTIKKFGLQPRSKTFELDETNTHRTSDDVISDQSLFRSFSDCSLLTADISPYEGADFVFDICDRIPYKLRGRFDFIIDGGSLDNVFDPFRMLQNMTKMLSPSGRLLLFAWSNSFPTAYVKVSPDWIMDYFAVNEFADCKVYPVEFPHLVGDNSRRYITVFNYDPQVVYSGQIGYECSSINSERPLQTYCIAEKATGSTHSRSAVQKHYRSGKTEPYLSSIARFKASRRPLFHSPTGASIMGAATISDFGTLKPIARWQT
jgi:hypothetical protein